MRFTDLCRNDRPSPLHLREKGDAGIKTRFEALWQAEQQPLAITPAVR